MGKVVTMGFQSDHESGYFEGDDCVEDDELEIIHEEIVNPGPNMRNKGIEEILPKIVVICCFRLRNKNGL